MTTANLLDFDLAGLAAFCERLGEKRFRAVQLFRWIHQKGASRFDDMTDLARSLRDKLEAWIDSKKDWPILTTSIAKKWLNDGDGLQDRGITRDLHWGVPVRKGDQPWPGMEGKVFYVWFDAPIEYIAGTAEWADANGLDDEAWQRWWRTDKGASDVTYYQFMGKDNVPFHTLSFPATILGSGEPWKLVDYLKSFNYLNYDGGQFSTSQGRGVFMDQALSILPADYWRWWLLSHAPESSDSEFTWKNFQETNNNELVNNLANFVNRVLVLSHKFYGGIVPSVNTDLAFKSGWAAEKNGQYNEELATLHKKLEEMGGEARGSTPEEMKALVASELQRWTQVVADAREAWLLEDAQRAADPSSYDTRPEDAWQRLKGLARLEVPAQRAAARIAAWRETEAIAKNRPRGWIVEDELVYRLAERRPSNKSQLAELGLPPKTFERHHDMLLEQTPAALAVDVRVEVRGLGDLAEQCIGHYPSQQFTVDRTRREQLQIVRELITLAEPGLAAVTAPFTAAKDSDCIIVIGARPAENHPVAATFLKQAAKRGVPGTDTIYDDLKMRFPGRPKAEPPAPPTA